LLIDPQNVTRFREEMVSDQIKLLEAVDTLFDDENVEERRAIQGRIEFYRQELAKEGMKEVAQMMAAELAGVRERRRNTRGSTSSILNMSTLPRT
jgi:hypothetical protein